MTTWRRWAEGLVRGVANAAKSRRTQLGLTAAELSDRTASGKPLSRAVVSDLETGRKKTLEVSELLTLAVALELSPLSLLYPNVLDEVEVLPGVHVKGLEALGWFTGLGDAMPGVSHGPIANLFASDQAIRLAVNLVQIEQTLKVQRHNLLAADSTPELLGMSEQMRELQRHRADGARHEIEVLEGERKRLMHLYAKVIESSDD